LQTKKTSATREQLIDAAEALICNGGLSALTTQKLARQCGLAEGTIYRHFASREELIVTALRERLPGTFRPHVDALVSSAGEGSIENNVRRFISEIVPVFSIIAPTLGMLAADPALAARNAEAMHDDGTCPGSLVSEIAGYFAEEQRLGRIPRDIDPRAAAGLLFGLCFYRSLMQHLFGEDPTKLSDDELSYSIAKIVGRGVGNAGAAQPAS
jgi:AcrR family transcriptional regulator